LLLLGIENFLGHSTRRLVAVSTTESQLKNSIQSTTTKISDEVGNGTWPHWGDLSQEIGDCELFFAFCKVTAHYWHYRPPGTLSYMWEQNNASSNGGPSLIELRFSSLAASNTVNIVYKLTD